MEPERKDLLYSAGSVADIKVSLSLPIELEGENVAYFSLDSFSTPAAFDDEAVEMARVFAQQIAALLKRFKLEGGSRVPRLSRSAYRSAQPSPL